MTGLISLDMSRQRLMRYALTTVLSLTGKPVMASQIFTPLTFGPDGEALIRRECFSIDLGGNMLVAPDPRSNSVRSVESVVRQMAQMGCKCVAIDQAQNIREFVPDERGQVADVIGSIKRMARKFGVCIVLVHQIGRAGSDRPKLEHLKDSGCFEEFSDFVVILHDAMKTIHAQHGCYVEEHTGNYRAPKKDDDDCDVMHDLKHNRAIEINLAKSRNGETGLKAINFDFEQGIKL
jgi:replicative DNA helicase